MGITSVPSNSRERVLTGDKIKATRTASVIERVRPAMLAAIKPQLLTRQRAGEALAVRWADIDAKARTWTSIETENR